MTEFSTYPGSRRFTVVRSAGRRAARVRLLAGAADWRRDTLDRIGAAAIWTLGTRWLPATDPWPWPPITPETLLGELHVLPDLRILAAAAPRQSGRHRLSILAEFDGSPVVLKLGAVGAGIERETEALRLLTADPLPGIATPTVIAAGRLQTDGGLAFLATDALGLDGQRPAIDVPLHSFEIDIGDRLSTLPRPTGTDGSFVPVHGDLAPWNLRRTGRGLALFDWEAAGWGPPGSDLEHYRAACDNVRRGRRTIRA